jgi:hypothetical protein
MDLQREIRDWVVAHQDAPPKAILAALVGNAVALSRALGISREGFLQTVAASWDSVESRRNQREGRSS